VLACMRSRADSITSANEQEAHRAFVGRGGTGVHLEVR
jgi:hypothetical protein